MTGRNRHQLTSEERKLMPADKGFLRYFPDAAAGRGALVLVPYVFGVRVRHLGAGDSRVEAASSRFS